MSKTPHLQLPFVQQNQVQKEVTVNEALLKIDALLNTVAIDYLNIPPETIENGDLYIIGDSPEEAWSDYAGFYAFFYFHWRFIKPGSQTRVWVSNHKSFYYFDGVTWNQQVLDALSSFNQPFIRGYTEALVMHDNAHGAISINVTQANIHYIKIEGNIAVEFTINELIEASTSLTLIIEQSLVDGFDISWPDYIKWPEGNKPVLTKEAGAIDVFTFCTVNNGEGWLGFESGKNFL